MYVCERVDPPLSAVPFTDDDDGNNVGLMSEWDFHNNANTAAVQNKLLNATYCTLRYVSLLVLFGYIAVLGLRT